jgi:hypothetical protein
MRPLICALTVALLLVGPARANDWTPFYDPVFEVDKTYERSATVAWLGGEKYILLVTSDTEATYVVYAKAKEGVVKSSQLGERLVKATVVSREKDPSGTGYRVQVEILSVK